MHFCDIVSIALVILFPAGFQSRGREKRTIKILGVFGPEEKEGEFVFLQAVEEANDDLKRTDWLLEGETVSYTIADSFYLSKEICRHLHRVSPGYSAIFGPDHFEMTSLVRSLTKAKKIPHIDTRWVTSLSNSSDVYINLFPEATLLEQAISNVLEDMDWETFTLIYESAESLIYLQEVLKEKMGRSRYDRPTIIMKILPKKLSDYRPFLKEIKNSSETRILLHCSPDLVVAVLEKAKEVGLLGAYQNFFITSLGAHTIDFSRFRPPPSPNSINTVANITTFRLINPGNTLYDCLRRWNKKVNPSLNITITEETIRTDTALTRDAVMLFTQALKDMPKNFSTKQVDCLNGGDSWDFGIQLMDKMKSIEYEGLSGLMEFAPDGSRTFFSLDIIEASQMMRGFRTLGSWDPFNGVKHRRNQSQIREESNLSIANMTLRVVSKIVPPYLFRRSNGSIGNDAYEGFCKDLLDELAAFLKFNYTLYIPEGNSDPGELDPDTGRYSGLIGELTEYRADAAICDFTITPERKKAVDFTTPFMSLGIGILYTVAPAKEASYFSFLDPLDMTVWMYVATAYLSLSVTLYIIGRCTPHEWEGAHPCDLDPEELENALTLKNCLWLALGTVLQQGSDILPKACSTKVTSSVWSFFTLIMTTTYTANLAAFLTTQRMEPLIKSVEDLANQDEVKYGCLKRGATADFFKTSNDSLYQRMYATMESANPSVFSESNQKGVERVQRSRHKYAFFMESSSIDYEQKLDCSLTKIGSLLDSKFYGIAVPMGSKYRAALTAGILYLQENTKVDQLKSKWWRDPENKTCIKLEDEDKDKLGVANVGGVFLLLILGCMFSFFVSILEFLWNVRKVAVREKILLSEAFWLELKFACRCSKTTKPLHHTPQGDMLGTPLSVSQITCINKDL